MRKPFCCDANRDIYDKYYSRQQKGDGDFPVYIGRATQQGHGLGSILSSLWRRVLPILKAYGPHALRAGANIVEDVTDGKTWKNSAFNRIPESISAFAVRNKTQKGAGGRRRKRAKRRAVKKFKKDIFS